MGISLTELGIHLAGGTADEYVRLRREFGRRARWFGHPPDRLRRARLTPERIARLQQMADGRRARRELEACQRAGIRLVSWRQADYPARLRRLPRPPLVLSVVGRWPPPEAALSIVGARAATPYGRSTARRLAALVTRAEVAVVSGLARGIDREALLGALDEQGWPIAVLGSGLDVAYPPEHRGLQRQIARQGTLISEFPLGQRPTRFAFPRRNRIIAAISRAVLVVEAGARSGALITADHALELGRDVLAVPGPIDSEASRGSNRLIFDGASPVIDGAALLALIGADSAALRSGRARAAEEPLLDALGDRAATIDELALRAGRPPAEVRSALIALELAGRVRRLDGGRYRRHGPGC
jgi:DNA processing protein